MSNTLWAINGHLVVKVIGFFIVIASFIDYKHPRHGFHSKLVQTIFIFVIILHKQKKTPRNYVEVLVRYEKATSTSFQKVQNQ